ncbi:MAG: hypothetical protein MRJ92_13150 [Nitrospira sp.]|nr:hypothetical protein [Nitrospira sp.]
MCHRNFGEGDLPTRIDLIHLLLRHGLLGKQNAHTFSVPAGFIFDGFRLADEGARAGDCGVRRFDAERHLEVENRECRMGRLHLRHQAVDQPCSLIDFGFRLGIIQPDQDAAFDDLSAFARRQIYDAPRELAGHGDVVAFDPAIGLNQPFRQPVVPHDLIEDDVSDYRQQDKDGRRHRVRTSGHAINSSRRLCAIKTAERVHARAVTLVDGGRFCQGRERRWRPSSASC